MVFFSFSGGELLLFGSGSPLIISLERTLQGKVEFIRACNNIHKNIFSHFTEILFPGGSQPKRKITEIPGGGGGGGGYDKHPLEWKF